MSGGENEFWAGVARTLNPGWNIKLGSKWVPGGECSGSHDLYVYAIDVSTGWTCLAGMPTAEARRLIAKVEKDAPDLCEPGARGVAAEAIAKAGQMPASEASANQEAVMVATTLAVSTTKSFEVARPGEDGLTTHCLYLSYRAKDGSFIGRPALIKSRVAGAVPPAELNAFVRRIVGLDTAAPAQSDVGRMIASCGGTSIARELL